MSIEMHSDLLLQNGQIVTPKETIIGDVLLRSGKIAEIGKISDTKNCKTIDLQGNILLPGGIDAHVHFGLRVGGRTTADDLTSGTKAALAGGVTTIIDYTDPAVGSQLLPAFQLRKSEGDKGCFTDWSMHSVIQDWHEETRQAVDQLLDVGITSFKVFMVYDQKIDDQAFLSLLEYSKKKNFLVEVHCESAFLLGYFMEKVAKNRLELGMEAHKLARPAIVEAEAVERACAMATAVGASLHIVHMSAGESAKILARYRSKNPKISGETAPHYLFLTDDVFDGNEGHLYATCPQIKEKYDRDQLTYALLQGVISLVATDHCAFTRQQKDEWQGDYTKIPYGMPGVETSLPLLYTNFVATNRMSLQQFAQITATNPARRFGMYPSKGAIIVGADADLIVIDSQKKRVTNTENAYTAVDYVLYGDKELTGFPERVFLRGIEVMQQNSCLSEPIGQFLRRGAPLDV
jgi:dihydropyrimidinase